MHYREDAVAVEAVVPLAEAAALVAPAVAPEVVAAVAPEVVAAVMAVAAETALGS